MSGFFGNSSFSGTISSGTITASAPALTKLQTWNNAGVKFTADLTNITDTASAAGSLFVDYQVAGASKFAVNKSGQVQITRAAGVFTASFDVLFRNDNGASVTTGSLFNGGGGQIQMQVGGTTYAAFGSSGLNAINAPIGLGTVGGNTGDVLLYRDAAAILAQRNGTTAQTQRIYRTYTDASNYQRLNQTWNTTTALIMNEGAGTGADGSVAFNDAALATNATKGFLMIPGGAGIPTGVPADIPTGQVPLYYDTTNNKLYAYNGAWKASGVFA